MEKLKMKSLDVIGTNIDKIAQLFPNCVTEHLGKDGKVEFGIDFEKLKAELSNEIIEEGAERYQFTWPDKRKANQLANIPTTMTLRPCREESVDFENTENLYIEGDNLDVLKVLRETYLGKVKMIYIDPPYNTGNDFVYNDDFAQGKDDFEQLSGLFDDEGNQTIDPMQRNTESNGRFHTDWLNMIYPRLKVARDLLSDDGVILINMDENEITNLLYLCNEIFGVCNDLGTIIWDKRNPKGDAKGISSQHEYIVVFAKDKDALTSNCKIQRPKKNAKLMLVKAKQLFAKIGPTYTLDDANSDFAIWLAKQTDLSGGERAYNRIDTQGRLYQAVSMAWPNKKKAPDEYFTPLIHPITGKPCPVPEKGWRNPVKTMQYLLEQNMIIFGADENTQPRRKYMLDENMYENIPSLLYYGGSDAEILSNMGIPFDTPKVTDICKEHIQSFTEPNDIILDFFSGSATTAHAVMKLNAEDGGKRKFIMVQLPEKTDEKSEAYKAGYKNICEIGKERIRRAGNKIKEELGEKAGNLDTGFRVLKLDSSNMEDVYYTPEEFTPELLFNERENIKEDRTNEDLLFQVMLDLGIELSAKIESKQIAGKEVYFVEDTFLVACFDKDVNESTITEIAKLKPIYFVMRDASASSDNVIDNFEQIFKHYSPDTDCRII
ncbi:MAG: site-specific DNA-methyltransferase [Bacteroidales bacterium]|nr:site-specific DNA-methyltransferase [Bacteroidales bacterium]